MDEEQKDFVSEPVKVKSLRLALIASETTVSEYFIFLEHLLVGLADESIPTALVCPPDCDVSPIVLPAVEVTRHPVFDLPLMGRQNNKILVEKLERFKPTVLHCLCESKAGLVRYLAGQLNTPYLLTVNSLHSRRGQLSISQGRCTSIVTPAESIALNLRQLYPKFVERIRHINIGTFVRETSRCFIAPERLASMVTVHPPDDVNDFKNLFTAVRHLTTEGYEFMLAVIGNGKAERALWKLLDELELLKIVTIVPRLEPWRAVLAAGDIFIQPQPNISFNPLLLEAMAVGAAVAGCKGGVDELIIEGQTAVVFNPDDELSIRGCLKQLLDRSEFARRLAGSSQEYLRRNRKVSGMISALLDAYHNAEQWHQQ